MSACSATVFIYFFIIISVLCWKPDLLFRGMTDICLVLELLNGMWMWIKITLYTVHDAGMLLHCRDDRCLFTRVVCNIASWLFMLESTSGAICCPAHLTVTHFVGILCLSTNLCLSKYLIVYSNFIYLWKFSSHGYVYNFLHPAATGLISRMCNILLKLNNIWKVCISIWDLFFFQHFLTHKPTFFIIKVYCKEQNKYNT